MLMINPGSTELVARCVPLESQHATINQNSATNRATINATNSLKALASMVLERNNQSNSSAINTQKSTQLIDVKNTALVAQQLRGVLTESDKQKISAWVHSLGGGEETIAEELTHCLGQCRDYPEALAYFLKRAEGVGAVTTPIALVQCGLCQNFTPHHQHGKGTGTCTAGVMPSGVCHWGETQHTCDGFKPKEQQPC